MPRHPLHKDSPWLLIILASLVALGPLNIDMYLPALPSMVDDLATTTSRTQLTISSFLVGFAIFHLVCGPLADRFGRIPILIGGMLVFVVATVACARASTIEELIFYRFAQGMGACVGPTLGRAMARDIFGPHKAARALAYIAMIMALAPAVAPTLGGILLEFFHWTAIFYVLAGYALLAIVIVWMFLPESLPEVQSLHPIQIGRNYLQLIVDRRFIATTTASSLLYAGMVSYLSGSSFIFIGMMGVSEAGFGLLFLPTVAGYIAGNAISTRLSHNRSSEAVMWIGVQLALLSAVCMLLAGQLYFHPVSIVLPISAFSASLGLVLPHAMATALRPFPEMAGTASALLGFIQMGLSSVAGALVGIFLVDSALPMTLVITCLTGASWLLTRGLREG
jgi:DHA1 family bicyclomycin/chloramphenicol resistance-like MFS transporter